MADVTQLTPHIARVELMNATRSNIYLVRGADGDTLVDPGPVGTAPLLLALDRRGDFRLARVVSRTRIPRTRARRRASRAAPASASSCMPTTRRFSTARASRSCRRGGAVSSWPRSAASSTCAPRSIASTRCRSTPDRRATRHRHARPHARPRLLLARGRWRAALGRRARRRSGRADAAGVVAVARSSARARVAVRAARPARAPSFARPRRPHSRRRCRAPRRAVCAHPVAPLTSVVRERFLMQQGDQEIREKNNSQEDQKIKGSDRRSVGFRPFELLIFLLIPP